jgi:hypothetical protein
MAVTNRNTMTDHRTFRACLPAQRRSRHHAASMGGSRAARKHAAR